MDSYPKHGFKNGDIGFSLSIDSEKPMSYDDLAGTLRDIEAVFAVSSKEVNSRINKNARTGKSALVITRYREG